MNDRTLAAAISDRLGPDALRRLRSLRRRLWLRRALRVGVASATVVLAVVALVQLVARTVPLAAAPWLMVAVTLAGLLTWIALAVRRRPSLAEAARRADEELALAERLGTAAELVTIERDSQPDAAVAAMVARQLADARARLGEADLRAAFRPRLERRPLAAAGTALALLLLLTVWPNPQDAVLHDRDAARQASREVAERIEKVADEAEQEGAETDDPRRDALVDQLRRLARQLRESGEDRQAVLAEIGSVQEQLAAMTDPQAAQKDAALTQLARQVSRAATGDEDANEAGDPEEAALDLEELREQVGSLSGAQASARADALRRAAQGASAQPDLARRLTKAADALEQAARSGEDQDQDAAQDALQDAADALRQGDQDRQLQRSVARAQSVLQDGGRQVARAGQPQPGSSGQPQPGSSGQPQPGSSGQPQPGSSGQPQPGSSGQPQPGSSGQPQPGSSGQPQPGNQPGNQPGTGNQPGPGTQPGGGGGATARRIPGGGLRTGGFDGPTQGNKGFDVSGLDDLFAPFDRIGRPGDPSFIAGQGGDGGTDQTGSGTGIGFDNDAVVPYRSVFDLFSDFANHQLDRQQVPITLKDLVRDYFTRLEPTN